MSQALMRKLIYIIAILCACRASHAASTNDLVIDVAAPPENVQLGFGWLQPERNANFSFVWMNHLEADVWVTLESASAAEIEIKAVPYYLNYRSQSLGLYVNGRFIQEWVCPVHSEWQLDTYAAKIPDGILKPGKNRITLRAGYRIGDEGKQLSIAVNSITLHQP
jgi:hypothetical protein